MLFLTEAHWCELKLLWVCTTIVLTLYNAVCVFTVSSTQFPILTPFLLAALSRFAFGHNKHLKSAAAAYWKPQSGSVLTSLPSFAVKGSGSGYTTPTHYMPHGSIVSSPIAPLLRVGNESQPLVRDGRVSTSSPLASSGIMHGSPLSDDSSQHSDSGALNDSVSNGILHHSRRRPLDNAIYSQCVIAMWNLAKDPSPRVASLGRRVLSVIGIEQVVAKSIKSAGASARLGESAASTSLAGLARSSSWFELNGGKTLFFAKFFLDHGSSLHFVPLFGLKMMNVATCMFFFPKIACYFTFQVFFC